MADIYINLEADGTGHAGTSGDPWSYLDLQDASGTPTGDTFYIRGSIDLDTENFYGPNGADYRAWDLASYGPWRVKANAWYSSYPSTNEVTPGTVRDAILDFGPVNFNPFGYYYNVYLKLNQYYDAGNATFSGCYIDVALNFLPGKGIFRDCCISAGSYSSDGYAPTLINCALTGTDPGYNLSDCQTDWIAPTPPAWDAAQSAFYTAILFSDVDTPPQPGSPPYTNYTNDLWGNPRTGIGTGYMLSAVAPVWSSTYPKAGTIGGNTAEILVQTNETGMAYFVALPGGDTGPSAAQVKDGLNSVGVTGIVGQFGSVHLDADTEASLGATGLTSETNYDIWVVAENDALDLQEFATGINITTTDITHPAWQPSNPEVLTYGSTGAQFTVGINETGSAYFLAVPNNETGPSSVQVRDGVNYVGVTGAIGQFGSINTLESGVTGTLSAANLTQNTSYDVYFVAEDASANLQASPYKLDLTTQGPPVISVQPVGLSRNEGQTAILTVTASGDPAITTYQWYKGAGVALSNVGRFSGVDTASLQITDLVVADTDDYYVIIGNGELPNTTSDIAHLSVTDVVEPVWVNSTPSVTGTTENTATFSVEINEAGNVYFVALPSGAIAPTSANVKAGTGSGGALPVNSGSTPVTANIPASLTSTGLVRSTTYDFYFVAEDSVPNLQATPVLRTITTPDTTAPSWINSTPSVTGTTENTATFSVEINEAGNVYFVALSSGAPAPTSAEVKDGTGSGGALPVNSGSTAVTANTPASLTSTGLVRSTTYDFYFVAEDSVPNLQATPVLRTVTTPDTTGPSWAVGSPNLTGATIASATFSVEINEAGNVYFVALSSGATAPTSIEVKAGTGSGGASPVNSGSTAVTANTPASLTSLGLTHSTVYDFYFVAEDSVPNLQATPVLLTVATLVPFKDLPCNIGVYALSVTLGTPVFGSDKLRLPIPFTGSTNPASTANLSTYEYSLDGSTWSTMTLTPESVINNLSFTISGSLHTIYWLIKEDLGGSIYNKQIYIRIRATRGTMLSNMSNNSLYFSKQVINSYEASQKPKMPSDYQGISGSDLLEKAPKSNI